MSTLSPSDPTKREEVSAGEGYRLLRDGERIEEEDQFYNRVRHVWVQTGDVGLRHYGEPLRRRRLA